MQGKAKRIAPKSGCPGRKDANQDAIVKVLEQMGCKVGDTSQVGFGFPDLVIGVMGIVALVEIKNPETFYGRQELSGFQREFHEQWGGAEIHIIRTQDEAIALVKHLRSRELDWMRQVKARA